MIQKTKDHLVNNYMALNKVKQTHHNFNKITAVLGDMLGISFGYMIIFKDNSYYTIQHDLDCLTKFVTEIEKSSIFCSRNVTNSFDQDKYIFTLWPSTPISSAMEIYFQHNIWNGITVSELHDYYTELYWFNGGAVTSEWHKFFIRNKPLLLKFINYFNNHKELLQIDERNITQGMFKFKNGFDINIPESVYLQNESSAIKALISKLDLKSAHLDTIQQELNLSRREVEVLVNICHGYTMKSTAQKLKLSAKTIESYIDRIKHKTGLRFKTDLIKFYEDNFNRT
jgi:DNA-binding CsgD family transcriptional regulator